MAIKELIISSVGLPPASIRGITQTLEYIDESIQTRRNVNGELVDISDPIFRKFRSIVACEDQIAPAINGIWAGRIVTVDCVAEIPMPPDGIAERPIVAQRQDSGFILYRPRLVMMILKVNIDYNDWDAIVGWQMELEEV